MKRKNAALKQSDTLVREIYSVQNSISEARNSLRECGNPLLMEATAYEIKYLQAKYSYLLDIARRDECSGLRIFR